MILESDDSEISLSMGTISSLVTPLRGWWSIRMKDDGRGEKLADSPLSVSMNSEESPSRGLCDAVSGVSNAETHIL